MVVPCGHLLVQKDEGTKREKQAERLKELMWVYVEPHVRRDCEIAGGGWASETTGTCRSEM